MNFTKKRRDNILNKFARGEIIDPGKGDVADCLRENVQIAGRDVSFSHEFGVEEQWEISIETEILNIDVTLQIEIPCLPFKFTTDKYPFYNTDNMPFMTLEADLISLNIVNAKKIATYAIKEVLI